jgi:hypothetical protein
LLFSTFRDEFSKEKKQLESSKEFLKLMLLLTQYISLEVAETSTVTNMEHIVTTTLCILMIDKTKDVRIKITIEIRDSKVMCR